VLTTTPLKPVCLFHSLVSTVQHYQPHGYMTRHAAINTNVVNGQKKKNQINIF